MKTRDLILLALVIGGGYWYYKKYMQKPQVTQPGTPDVPGAENISVKEDMVKAATEQLNSSNSVNISILDQIKEMNKPTPVITYQKFYKPDIDAANPEQSYQTFYASINGKRMGVPYLL